ncbi:MAG TPA: XshC-Cox1 family protein, partial [Phaeodactylibacter sp.]|nr:XshC-Cox1 family protein [Phaeodactylibacter sp.]
NNYDILPMLRMGRELGWAVSVVMNPVRAKAKLRELAAQIYPKDSEVPVDAYTAFILMAHDYETDKNNLARVLPTDVPYIGMLGPVKRRKRSLEELEASGLSFSEEQLARLYNPIGLDIGATTPEEIALSALAEIKAHFAQRRGMPLRERVGAIHTR